MSESLVKHAHSFEDDVAMLQAQFEALHIPDNIDPRLLALWIDREKEKIERSQHKEVLSPPPLQYGYRLARLFPSYIGIAVMCLAVVLGLVQCQEPTAILQTACVVFLVYTVIGFFVGMVAERCVRDSVEALLRDIVSRSREAGKNAETPQE